MSARHGRTLAEPRHATEPTLYVIRVGRASSVLLASAVVVATAGAAAAYFTTTGSGQGTASTGTTGLSAGSDRLTGLYPGASLPLPVRVTNDGDGPVVLTTVSPRAVTAGPSATCAASVTIPPSVSSSLVRIPAGGTGTVTLSVTMNSLAPNGCQANTFSVPVDVRGTVG